MELKFGTKEWAEKNLNLFTGNCKNACIHCYASANNARYKRDKEFKLKKELIAPNKKFSKRDYLTMYPSAHDIRQEDLFQHLVLLDKFLKSGSPILIVTKPDKECVQVICDEFLKYREQIEWRFTIGSTDDKTLRFWDTNAPTFGCRRTSAIIAYSMGYKTSLSIEPMLDEHPEEVILKLFPYITGDIWLGKMNFPKQRIASNDNNIPDLKMELIEEHIAWQANDNNILEIVKQINRLGKKYKLNIRWKESIQKVINKQKTSNQ